MNKLSIRGFTLSFGAVWGISTLLLGWMSILGWGEELVIVFSSIYIGYSSSFLGGIIGSIWGFADGAVFGLIVSYFYNMFCEKKERK